MIDRPSMSGSTPVSPGLDVDLRAPGGHLGNVKLVMGQSVGQGLWEIAVAQDPAEGLASHLERQGLDFIVLHGLGGLASRRFLGDMAQGCGAPLERLIIRREGVGQVMASLCFADLRASNGRVVRVFSSDVASDHGATKITIRALLLGRARTAVALLSEMSPVHLEDALVTMGRTVSAGGDRHRSLVILPAYEAAMHAASPLIGVVQQSNITVRRAEAVRQPADAWPFLSGTWLMDRAASESGRASMYDEGIAFEPVDLASVVAEPVPEDFGVDTGRTPLASPVRDPAEVLVRAILTGLRAGKCCVFNMRSLAVLAQAGSGGAQEAAQMARQGRLILAAMQTASQPLQVGKGVREAMIRFGEHVLVMQALHGAPDLWVMALFDAPAHSDTRAYEEALAAAVRDHWSAS